MKNHVTITEEILTKEQVCDLLGIKERTLEELLRAGKLRAKKLNRRWVILKSDVIAYIQTSA